MIYIEYMWAVAENEYKKTHVHIAHRPQLQYYVLYTIFEFR